MTAKHTSGPWQAVATPFQDGFTVQAQPHPAMRGFTRTIAYVGNEATDENRANAALIAAAPDLLAALKDAMRSSRKDFKAGPDGDRQHQEAYAEQFAALSKAQVQS